MFSQHRHLGCWSGWSGSEGRFRRAMRPRVAAGSDPTPSMPKREALICPGQPTRIMLASMNDFAFSARRSDIDSLAMQAVPDRRLDESGIAVIRNDHPATVNWGGDRSLHCVELLLACLRAERTHHRHCEPTVVRDKSYVAVASCI